MALGELLVSLAAVKRWMLLLQIQSSRTGRLVPVWIGRLHHFRRPAPTWSMRRGS